MALERHDFTLTFKLLSDLHLGNGETRTDIITISEDGKEKRPQVARIARDFEEKPYVPGTSIKGVLRGLCKTDAQAKAIFGASADETSGNAGKLILWGGRIENVPDEGNLPYWCKVRETYVGAHVAIDPTTGTAEDKHLFYREYIPKGATFSIDSCWQGPRDEINKLLLPLFNRAAAKIGFALGKASRAGFGRVKLEGISKVLTKSISTSPYKMEVAHWKLDLEPTTPNYKSFTLYCEGPFLIVDPKRAKESGENDHVDMRTVQRDHSIPELLGTSLIGVLRSRASWLHQVAGGKPDDRNAKFDGQLGELSPVQRLFGINGWAGQFRIVGVKQVGEPTEGHIYPSVALDDFTQGAIPGALFMKQAPANASFKVDWILEQRNREDQSTKALMDSLINDIRTKGIKIGHSTGTGFGWFEMINDKIDNKEVRDAA